MFFLSSLELVKKTLRASPTAEILSHFSLPGSFDGFLLGFVVVVVVVGVFLPFLFKHKVQ